MAARKLQQEVDKCFKKVAEGVAEFEGIYEKIEQSNNLAQKEKLEDNLKREIKKLQRLRDQIKTWAASNDIKDKGPLLEHRRLIETQMEKFKAVEKAMKTKAYSKEGLSAAAKLDPKEQAKLEMSEFLGEQIDILEQQIEQIESEAETIQASAKKGKVKGAQAERIATIEAIIERHKWHQGKMELVRRLLENGGVEAKQVEEIKDNIEFYVAEGMTDGFMEDDTVYDDLALDEDDEAAFGMGQDGDKGSSQDAQSVQEEAAEDPKATTGPSPGAASASGAPIPGKPRTAAEAAIPSGRRPSTQMKSPLPTLATLHTPLLPTISNGPSSSAAGMKPASVPSRPAGEGLKYASAAAAAAASDRSGVGIAPLPPPPGMPPVSVGMPPAIASDTSSRGRTSSTNSPSIASVLPAAAAASSSTPAPQPQPPSAPIQAAPSTTSVLKTEKPQSSRSAGKAPAATSPAAESLEAPNASRTNGVANGVKSKGKQQQAQQAPPPPPQQPEEEESIYHLPSSLRDLVESFETTKKRPQQPNSLSTLRSLQQSQATQPDLLDADAPPSYQPDVRFHTASEYPQEPLSIFNDPRLYSKLDTDTLFYIFYYKQGTYQQYLAAKALKDQSWRFHKQYQTWFQRHEEPKNITEEFEQGTYRFFDYESTWMNRRKADFKFAYKFLEDDV